MGIGKSKPKAPDPVATAQAQSGLNREAILESARHNQINQTSPLGEITWTGALGSPDRTQHTTLSPEQQALLEQTQRTQAGVGGLIESLLPQVGHALTPGAWVGQGLEGPNTYLNEGIPRPDLPPVVPGNLGEMLPVANAPPVIEPVAPEAAESAAEDELLSAMMGGDWEEWLRQWQAGRGWGGF